MECRLATESDKAQIIQAFPGINGGMDYVPHDYDYFMACPGYICYVGQIKGKIVAFMGTKLLDECTTYVVRSERVHVEYRGRGLMTQLNQYAQEYVKRYLKGPTVTKTFAVRVNEDNIKRIERHPEWKVIHTRVLLPYTLDMMEVRRQLANCKQRVHQDTTIHIREPTNLTSSEIKALKVYFSEYCKDTGNPLVVYCIPYGNYEGNWDDVLDKTSWMVTNTQVVQWSDNMNNLEGMILVKQRTCKLGLRYDLELETSHGRNRVHFTSGKLHSILERICCTHPDYTGQVVFRVLCEEMCTDEVNATVLSVLGEQHSVSPVKLIHLYEEIHI